VAQQRSRREDPPDNKFHSDADRLVHHTSWLCSLGKDKLCPWVSLAREVEFGRSASCERLASSRTSLSRPRKLLPYFRSSNRESSSYPRAQKTAVMTSFHALLLTQQQHGSFPSPLSRRSDNTHPQHHLSHSLSSWAPRSQHYLRKAQLHHYPHEFRAALTSDYTYTPSPPPACMHAYSQPPT